VAQKKTERLLNLVLCLLSTKRYLSVQEIREKVPGYQEGNDEAFRRMFERDKAELREIGVPLETGSNTGWEDDQGYRIAQRDYQLPDISLTADEAAAVVLAGRLWQQAPLAGATGSALTKLRAAGMEAAGPVGLEPRVGVTEPAFEACWQAARDGRRVRFDYRNPGRAKPQTREVEPWGVVSWHGRWYLVGHDLDRDAPRVFRLSRVVGAATPYGELGTVHRPAGVSLREMVARSVTEAPTATATVRVRRGSGGELRRAATAVRPEEDGWEVLEVGYSDPERLAERVAGYGADAVVTAPDEVRAAVVARLRAITEATG
jgi:proteasome accessory factor B